MPSVIQGAPFTPTASIEIKDGEYKYPLNLDLRPGSKLHNDILQRVMRMAEVSHAEMSKRYAAWNDIDNTLKVYIPTSAIEKSVKKDDVRKPVSIVVPYSYATLETLMAYNTKAFLSDTPFQYEGVAPSDTIGAKLLEVVVNQQTHRFKSQLDMYTSFRGGYSYGLGISTLNWSQKFGKRPVAQTTQAVSMFGSFIDQTKKRVNQDALLFEGNEVINIDPYRFLPDPNVSIHNIQNGEFVGWLEFKTLNKLLTEEAAGTYFNVKYLQQLGQQAYSKFQADQSSRMVQKTIAMQPQTGEVKYTTVIPMYVTLVPKEWNLPGTMSNNQDGSYPEIWLFVIANDNIVIKASPLGLNHGMYPVATNAPDFDGYSITPLARMELVAGLQTTLNWLFNSHVANVRKSINDMFIVDPSLVNMDDMENPEPGKLIKLRRQAWGRGVDGAVKQFNVNDITRGNINDADFVMNIMQKASAATDATMGIMREGGERRSASEFSGTMQMAISRLEQLARITSIQYMQDLAYFHASHTQQLMSQETYVKAVGDWPDRLYEEFADKGMLGNKVKVDPLDILVDFEVMFRDASRASADAIQNDFWKTVFQTIATQPQLGQEFDIARIFMHMARINGANNVYDFVRKGGQVEGTTVPNEVAANEAQKGNLIDLNQMRSAMSSHMAGASPQGM